MANELTPWVPGCLVVGRGTYCAIPPVPPALPATIAIERIAREAIVRAAARSYWQYHAGRDNG